MYKQHALVRNLDEQEEELADYICSIRDDYDTPEFKLSILYRPHTPVCELYNFPVVSSFTWRPRYRRIDALPACFTAWGGQ